MRILFFCPTFGQLGGIERKAESLLSEFRRRGHDVAVLARGPAGRGTRSDVAEYRLPFRNLPSAVHRIDRHLRFWLTFPFLLRATRRILHELGSEVILTLAVSPYTPYTTALARERPLIFCIETAGPDLRKHPAAYRRALCAARTVIACASSLADEGKRLAPDAADHILFVPNGVDLDRFSAEGAPTRRARPFVLGVGRLDRQKGFDVLIDALGQIEGADTPELVIAGDGPDREALEERARRGGVADRVVFLGAQSADAVAGLYRGATLVAAPSRWEGLPLVCLEALACGAPMVAAAVDGITDVITHDETGLLVPPEDAGALAKAIRALLVDPARRARLGATGLARVRREFSWSVVAEQYLALLERAHRRQ